MHTLIADLFRHMEWADATVWNAVLQHEECEADATLRDRLVHIHGVQRAFFSIWTGSAIDYPDARAFPSLGALCRWGREYHAAAAPFVTEETRDLQAIVVLPWAEQVVARFGTIHDTTLAETMIQVTSHSTYHRGQVNARLRELGAVPPLVDYIGWIWLNRPAPAWPDVT
jgi:uncharacterized damage-inducible protein DinB